jgi:hypothetical protein
MTPPTITISTDFESGLHSLIAESYGYTAASFVANHSPNQVYDDLDLAQAVRNAARLYQRSMADQKDQQVSAEDEGGLMNAVELILAELQLPRSRTRAIKPTRTKAE